jgi:hypothetical protein
MKAHKHTDDLPGRHCHICGKPGGSGAATTLRMMGYEDWRDGKAHGPCLIKARKKQHDLQKSKVK